MRISDWSSDVCSSDLAKITYRDNKTLWREYEDTYRGRFFPLSMYARRPVDIFVIEKGKARRFSYSPSLFQAPHDQDRKSVVEGKSLYVRVDLGGCRFIKKKQKRKRYEQKKKVK